MLEKMGDFFEARLKGYEEHQLTNIDSAREFYPFTARCLPQAADACMHPGSGMRDGPGAGVLF